MSGSKRRVGVLLLLVALVVVACGGDSGDTGTTAAGGTGTTAAEAAEEESGGAEIIRFAFAPDPVWDYMTDTGTLTQWEEDYNLRIVTSSTWDEFAYFAGGHGDIVSTATYELPLLEDKTGIKTVHLRQVQPAADHAAHQRRDSGYTTLADIPKGSKIAVPSAVSSTLVWGMFAKKLHNLDFRVGGGDFELVVEDHFVMAERTSERGRGRGGARDPGGCDLPAPERELAKMYDNKLPYEVYGDIIGSQHPGVMGNLTATKKWYDANREEAAAPFIKLWEDGIKAWRANQAKIISTYPQHFAVEEDEDIKAMQGYLADTTGSSTPSSSTTPGSRTRRGSTSWMKETDVHGVQRAHRRRSRDGLNRDAWEGWAGPRPRASRRRVRPRRRPRRPRVERRLTAALRWSEDRRLRRLPGDLAVGVWTPDQDHPAAAGHRSPRRCGAFSPPTSSARTSRRRPTASRSASRSRT